MTEEITAQAVTTSSPSYAKLALALSKAQAVMGGAKMDSVNPHFRSKYADLASVWDACREPLTKNELAVAQFPESEGKKVTVKTMLLHSSGEYLETAISAEAKDASPQAIGSVITYLRRYSLAAMVGIAPEDDDGQAAQPEKPTQKTPEKPSQAPSTGPSQATPNSVIKQDGAKASREQISKISIEMKRVFGDFEKDEFSKEAARSHFKGHTGKESRTEITKDEASRYIETLGAMPSFTAAKAS